jgi:type IV pilus assembly protein PilX
MKMLRFTDRSRLPRKQAGSSLVVSMIMLVVLMLMGVGAMVVSNTQYRMAGNLQFQSLASTNADSGLAQAENWLATNFENTKLITRVSGGFYPQGSVVPSPYNMSWDDTNSETVAGSGGAQRYMVEVLSTNRNISKGSYKPCDPYTSPTPCGYVNLYRVTARGTSARGAVNVVQSIYAVRLATS